LQVCAEASDGEEAVQKAIELKPDAVILDVTMPRLDGFQAAKRILESLQVPILMLSMHDGDEMIRLAISVGAKGFINKTAIVESLLTAVDIVMAGGTFFFSDSEK
jgi:DNA-binding NarL/FixJ family response regulator